MAATTDLTRLTTFQNHIEDMRNLVMCKICLKPLYEPYILACGHTYCYGCLRSWFTGLDNRRRKKNCPDCRAEVKISPSPNYILRDLVHMFISRTELLPEDETVDEHVAGKIAEADMLATDKEGKGLFQGVFRPMFHPLLHIGPFQDIADGVLRCPHCHWEIEEGMCNHCGYSIDEDEDYPDFSDEDDDDGLLTNDENSLASDDISNDSDYNSDQGIPNHFYNVHSTADDIDRANGMDFYSEEYGTPDPYGPSEDEDEDEMEGFIDDHAEDEPDEVDEDDIEQPVHRYVPQIRGRHYRIPDDDDDDEDEEGSQGEDGANDDVIRYNFQHTHRPHESDESDGDGSDESEDNGQDQVTNYDESDEDSRSVTPIARPVPARRRPAFISDDDDDDEDEDEADLDSHTEGFSQSDIAETDEHYSSDSDDTATPDSRTGPPQSSIYRRQRLDNHRKRRRTPDAWHASAGRDRSEPSSGSHERQPSRYRPSARDAHIGRSGPHFSGRIPISR